MSNANPVLDALLFLGHAQLKDGFFQQALETFSAAYALDANDERAIYGRGLASVKLRQPDLRSDV